VIEWLDPACIPEADEALRHEVRGFLREALRDRPAHQRARSWAAFDAAFSRALAQRGWIGLTLPREYGGAGRSAFARFVLVEELLIAGAPVGAHWVSDRQSGPLILHYGTEAQKRFYLPRICRAEAFFCIGMSEPNAGSDLASVCTRAARTETGWRLNGQKLWSTHAARSHFMIALVRTSGDADSQHQGLSQFIVDLSLPGITVRPIRDLAGDAHFAEVFFDEVDLGSDALLGTEGAGWTQVNAELAFERSGPERIYSSIVLLEPWLAWLRRQGTTDSAVQAQIGRIATELAVLRALALSVTARLERGQRPALEAALVKDLGTAFEQRLPGIVSESTSSDPGRPPDPDLRQTLSYLQQVSPAFSLRGGTREVLRGVIARGLGLR
jgi:alkylation response protein AidB-like acyl-CoA dehydrogenase